VQQAVWGDSRQHSGAAGATASAAAAIAIGNHQAALPFAVALLTSLLLLLFRLSTTQAAVPFGGYKDSGLGREKGEYALSNYTQVRRCCGGHVIDYVNDYVISLVSEHSVKHGAVVVPGASGCSAFS
jgi:hypothetical protein